MAKEHSSHFTVIIPTKDRADYLHHTLRTCALQDYDDLEVVVADDGSTDHTREVVEAFTRRDPRIRYATLGATVGMRDNFEFALEQAKPGYVIALGGDDGLLPHGIKGMGDALRETGQEMLTWAAPMFSYPNAKFDTGQLILHKPSKPRIVRSKDYLARQAGTLNYITDAESPMFYVKGVASTRLINRVKSRSQDGRFYACPTPDGYSGIVLAGETESFGFSSEPFSIYGISPTSQGMGYLTSDTEAKKRSENFFREVANRPMHAELAEQPYSPLITLMTADYLLTARDLPGWPGSFPPIDYRDLLLKSLEELAHGLYAEDRVSRELKILNQIAERHGLGAFFRSRVSSMKRRVPKRPFQGNGISPEMLFLDCTLLGVRDIFDAAYVSYCAGQVATNIKMSTIPSMLMRSVRYKMGSFRKGGRFPDASEWLGADKPKLS